MGRLGRTATIEGSSLNYNTTERNNPNYKTADRNNPNYKTADRSNPNYKTADRHNPNYKTADRYNRHYNPHYKTGTLPLPQDNQPYRYSDHNSSDYEQPSRHEYASILTTPLPEPPEESSLLQSDKSDPRYFKLDPDLVQSARNQHEQNICDIDQHDQE